MRILFPYLARWHAVNWTRYHSLLATLARMGHEIYVLQAPRLASAEGNFHDIEAVPQHNIHVHEVPLNSRFWETRLPLNKLIKKSYYSLVSVPVVRRLLHDKQIDALLLYNLPQYRLSGLQGVAQVFDVGDDYLDMLREELGRADNPIARAVAARMLSTMLTRADLVTCISHELAERTVGNVHVLSNGVDLEKSLRCQTTPIGPIHHGGKPVVGFLGSFEYFIDFRQMVDVARRLPQYHFLLVGAGRMWEPTRQMAAEQQVTNMQFTGGVPHEQVFAYIQAMDVCLHLFRPIAVSHRACPIKLFEYLSLRKPVISTRLDELKHIDEGFLYYADTVDEVVDQIEHVLTHRDEAQAKAELGHNVVVARYTWDRVARRFLDLLEPCVQRAAQGRPRHAASPAST